jgi:hypothetical protein
VDTVRTDVAVVICSRGRERALLRLLTDLNDRFVPALAQGDLRCSVWVYAQGYPAEYLASLRTAFAGPVAAGTLVITVADRPHGRIGDVVQAALTALNARCRYALAMLMDDDSVYYADPVVDENLHRAARRFIAGRHRAYSIKLGTATALEYVPFVNPAGPIMPFKEKMLWVSREVVEEVLALPRFAELSIGEDAVIAAVAWLPDPESCFGVFGIATFIHIGYEASEEFGGQELPGGYAELMNYKGHPPEAIGHFGKYDEALKKGITPQHVMPDVFVPEGHPLWEFNGIRDDVMVGPLRQRRFLGTAASA